MRSDSTDVANAPEPGSLPVPHAWSARRVGAWVVPMALVWGAPVAATAAEAPPRVEVVATPAEPQFDEWAAGTSRFWSIKARVVGGTAQRTHLRVAGSGALVTDPGWGLVVQVWRCSEPYQWGGVEVRPVCGGSEQVVVAQGRLAEYASSPDAVRATQAWSLPPATAQWQHLAVELRRPELADGAADVPVRSARFGVGVYASGDEPEVEPGTETNPDPSGGCGETACPTTAPAGGGLPDAGGPALWWVAVGGALVAAGAGVVTWRRR